LRQRERRAVRATLLSVTAWALTLLPAIAGAQPAATPEPPPRLEGSAQFTLLATTGNASTTALGAGGDLVWRPTPWMVKAKLVFAQSETDNVLSARSTVASFRADRFVTPRTSLYSQYDFLRDIFAGVEQRHTVAGGLAYRLIDHAPHRLTADGGLGYEHEAEVGGESIDSAIVTSGALYRWTFSETSWFTEELRYVQSLDTGEDWKLDQSMALTATITSAFSLKLSNIVRYVNQPPLGFETTDTITSVALVWTIRRPGP
jgi:putative salt-induced outer membrane protein